MSSFLSLNILWFFINEFEHDFAVRACENIDFFRDFRPDLILVFIEQKLETHRKILQVLITCTILLINAKHFYTCYSQHLFSVRQVWKTSLC